MATLSRLQAALGYIFDDSALLELALTHRSHGSSNNERLEFLGDSILNHVVAEELYQRFPNAREGELSRMRAALVKGDTLAEVAAELGLGEHLRLGSGERKSGGHRRGSILADTLEAILGAILLDGGPSDCRRCVLAWFDRRLQEVGTTSAAEKDAKTRLQEFLQGRGSPLPEYELVSAEGADHQREFRVSCRLREPELVTEGLGSSRRRAEQHAATEALVRLAANG
jgi:ribonuclease-3